MSTKKQHYVPRVYMKAWETTVETIKEPQKKFNGVYVINRANEVNGASRDSVLWKPHLYTIKFKYNYICKSCKKVKRNFVNMIFDYMQNGSKQPIYGKIGYSIIKTPKSIEKHFFEIDDWDFFYDDGNIAKKEKILNQIEGMNSYVLEESFDDFFEKKWESVYTNFVKSVHNGTPVAIGQSERIIPENIAIDMLEAFFIMLCRNPRFDAMGIYTDIKNNILYPAFKTEDWDGTEYADELMTGIWYSELYKMFYKHSGGFYHNIIKQTLRGCQMILFEAYENAGDFITSDNPAVEHISRVETQNHNGFYFPISPKYLVFIAKGSDNINIVDHRFANTDTIKLLNRIIAQHRTESIISNQKNINRIL